MTRTDNAWRARWIALTERWQDCATHAGLPDVMSAIQDGLRPLAPLAAQLLWVAQPTFGLIGEGDAIEALATLLEDPARRTAANSPHSQPPMPEGR